MSGFRIHGARLWLLAGFLVKFIRFFRNGFLLRKCPNFIVRILLRLPLWSLFGQRGFPNGSLLFLSLVFVRGASALRPDSGVEGLYSSTRAETRLRLTFPSSFLFSTSSVFIFFWFYRLVPQCRLFPDIYAGTLVCLSLLLAFIDVTLLDFHFF